MTNVQCISDREGESLERTAKVSATENPATEMRDINFNVYMRPRVITLHVFTSKLKSEVYLMYQKEYYE